MDLDNPFGAKTFDPSTGRRMEGTTQPLVARGQTQSESAIESEPDGLEWDNLKPQERAVWASVFGVAFNHALVCGNDEDSAFSCGTARARGAVRMLRRYNHG